MQVRCCLSSHSNPAPAPRTLIYTGRRFLCNTLAHSACFPHALALSLFLCLWVCVCVSVLLSVSQPFAIAFVKLQWSPTLFQLGSTDPCASAVSDASPGGPRKKPGSATHRQEVRKNIVIIYLQSLSVWSLGAIAEWRSVSLSIFFLSAMW